MKKQIPLPDEARAHEHVEGSVNELTPDLAYQRLAIVNVMLVGSVLPGKSDWVLVDAGVSGTATMIKRAAAQRFGASVKPRAIVLTHGHFDHVGALEELVKEWDVPVFANDDEWPFLDGSQSYPPPDTEADGGLMPKLARFFSRGPINVARLHRLPDDGSVPFMPGWRWIHTPGHTPGHISLWRASDRTLIAGDAFITTRQESAYAIVKQEPEMHGPPRYFTPDWAAAEASVKSLAALQPQLVVTGHGRAMSGETMLAALEILANNFKRIALPTYLQPDD
jgi:glyoxylase-like metal-dependent hydrolase (beta-lactamase superfamily II)